MFKNCSNVLSTLLAALLLSACGGAGGDAELPGTDSGAGSRGSATSSTHESSTAAAEQFTVSVRVSPGGQASPAQQALHEGQQAQIELLAEQGFRLQGVSGCDGSLTGTLYSTAPLSTDCQVDAYFAPSGAISGRLLPEHYTAVDVSINDKSAPTGNNNQCSRAQKIDNQAVVHGFASAEPTGGDSTNEHYADSEDSSDFYRLTLSVGQMAELEVADHLDNHAHLALFLWNSDCSQQIAVSSEGGEIEQVTSFLGGDSVLEVRAKSGLSKYVLRMINAWDMEGEATDLLNFSASLPEFIPGEVIIEFDPAANSQAHQNLSQALDRAQGLQLNFRHQEPGRATLATSVSRSNPGAQALRRPSALTDLKDLNEAAYNAINTLRMVDFVARQPGVRLAEPNFLLRSQASPNDPAYGNQWHYGRIQLPQAWDVTTGEGKDGRPVVIAILDTGVYLNHEDLRDKLLLGYDFHDNNDNPDELNNANGWHGTHVAGTAAASTNNGIGVAGVSWHARILPVRVLGDDGGTSYNVLQGVRYAAGLSNDSGTLPAQPADVINLSLGGGGYSSSAQRLYRDLYQSGVFVVAAAGNDNTDTPMYPASYDGVFSVSATDCHNNRASYSNYGPTISLAAPGGDSNSRSCSRAGSGHAIWSTVGSGSGDLRTSSYAVRIGTSMAAPHVAGVMALMRAVHPELTPEDFQRLLQDGAVTEDLGDPGRDDQFGYGLINAAKAVQAAQALATETPQWTANVVADPGTLNLKQASKAQFELRKEGDGEAPAVLAWRGLADWLSAQAIAVDEKGLGTYEIHVNRSLFSEDERADYHSALVFDLEDDTELSVSVHIQVGTATQTAPIYVILLDNNSGAPRYETLAQWHDSTLSFQFEGIAPGDYLLVAGSDIDADRVICQPGEMCGTYPDFAEPQVISITGQGVSELELPLNIISRTRPATDPAPEATPRPE